MTTPRNPAFEALLERMREIQDRKNRDYASDNNPYSNFEFAASVVRMFSDPVDQVFAALIGIKLSRLGELRGKCKSPHNESADDTHLDLAVFSALWASYYR